MSRFYCRSLRGGRARLHGAKTVTREAAVGWWGRGYQRTLKNLKAPGARWGRDMNTTRQNRGIAGIERRESQHGSDTRFDGPRERAGMLGQEARGAMRQKKSGPIAGDDGTKKYVEPNDVIPAAPRAQAVGPGVSVRFLAQTVPPGKPRWGFDSSWPASIGCLSWPAPQSIRRRMHSHVPATRQRLADAGEVCSASQDRTGVMQNFNNLPSSRESRRRSHLECHPGIQVLVVIRLFEYLTYPSIRWVIPWR